MCSGKSYLIKKFAEEHGGHIIRIPINSTSVQPSFIINRLNVEMEAEKRILHFDISSCAGSDVNLLLFKLIILQHISAQGIR